MKSRQDFTTKKGYYDYLLAYYTAIALPQVMLLARGDGTAGHNYENVCASRANAIAREVVAKIIITIEVQSKSK